MKKENFEVKIRKTIGYPKGNDIIQMLETMKGKALPMKAFFQWNDKIHKMEFAVEEFTQDNKIGILQDDGNIQDTLKDILDEGLKYDLALESVNGNVIKGTLTVSCPEVVAVEVKEDETMEKLKAKIIKDEICAEQDLERNIQTMRKLRCPDELIRQVLMRYRKFERAGHIPKTIYVDPDPKQNPSIFSNILLNVLIGAPLIFEGDKSVGKNVCAETVAMVMNMPYDCITMTRTMCGDDMYGTKSTDNSAAENLTEEMAENYLLYKSGDTDYQQEAARYEFLRAKAASVAIVQETSDFVRWIKNGGVMCLNEMNMAEANFFASFANQLTDGTGFLDIPGHGRVYVNKDCILIGTQNAEYTGTCEQNDATISRFGCIQFDYPKSIKKQLKAAVGETRLDDQYFSQVDAFYKAMLDSVRKNKVENSCLNIRGCVRALLATAVVPGLTKLADQLKVHVIDTCPIDDRSTLMLQLTDIVKL